MNRRVAVYAGTRNVYGQMAAAAKSLLNHTRMDRVWFLIEDDRFPEELPEVIQCANMADQGYFTKDGPNYGSPWSYMSLMRLAVPRILCHEERALWLDIDTLVMKDIGALFDMDLQGNALAMVEEPVRSKYPFRYHNSGVMLMDLQKMRMDGVWRKMISRVNREAFTAQDQDMLNIYCQGEILTIPPEWNDAGHITQKTDDPYIRHYAGCLKPEGQQEFDKYKEAEWRVKNAD